MAVIPIPASVVNHPKSYPLKFSESLKDRANQEMRWPVNADVVDGLVSCLDKSYVEAYSSVCREKGQ
ncbi:hypothetical protein BRO07_04750 [Xanthomonas oryzae pv. oryzae]|nr:hypothetical protein BRN28_18710 [Xanthomonas oryzae pv. oryzae]RBC25160.1 hypothetical protein BRN26_07360 [Xanthomonas oryzae pv. oryzae]RBH99735.1 hypothetical protein BRL98_17610 [Xanthomonas oryzae pv. oryzae]RBJ48555.1 hypothetical protein BRO07_04750 [Xanthomonas oryzae pv. oryzae]